MKVEVDSEVIAEVRNALQIIMGNAQLISVRGDIDCSVDRITKQVKRIDKLLPQVKYEKGK